LLLDVDGELWSNRLSAGAKVDKLREIISKHTSSDDGEQN
jgi:hypothetical protein